MKDCNFYESGVVLYLYHGSILLEQVEVTANNA